MRALREIVVQSLLEVQRQENKRGELIVLYETGNEDGPCQAQFAQSPSVRIDVRDILRHLRAVPGGDHLVNVYIA